jgi:hypothetical protein
LFPLPFVVFPSFPSFPAPPCLTGISSSLSTLAFAAVELGLGGFLAAAFDDGAGARLAPLRVLLAWDRVSGAMVVVVVVVVAVVVVAVVVADELWLWLVTRCRCRCRQWWCVREVEAVVRLCGSTATTYFPAEAAWVSCSPSEGCKIRLDGLVVKVSGACQVLPTAPGSTLGGVTFF